MAAVQTRSERALNRVAIAAVLVITLIFLAPIYWITSTAFKPRNLATTIPPTVLFEPELSPFVKLFTKRSQLRGAPTPEEYAAAPWWERMVFDGGEKIVRSGRGEVQPSGYPNRFMNSLIVAITSTVLAVGMGTFTAYGFSRFKVKGRQTFSSSSCRRACCRPSSWRSRCSSCTVSSASTTRIGASSYSTPPSTFPFPSG